MKRSTEFETLLSSAERFHFLPGLPNASESAKEIWRARVVIGTMHREAQDEKMYPDQFFLSHSPDFHRIIVLKKMRAPVKKKCYLSVQEILAFENLTAKAGEEALWNALGTIVPFLGQRLCLVDSYTEEFHGSAHLSTFHSRGAYPCELYLLVRGDGTVVLGSVAQLATQVKLVMAEFQPLADEVGTVLVTDQLRFGGSFHDILVMVHRSRPGSQAEVVLYHAEATWDGEKLHFNPMFSDPHPERKGWLPAKADRLPTWLLRWPIQLGDRQPIHLPPIQIERLEQLDREMSGQIDAVLCLPSVTCVVFADELRIFRQNDEPYTLYMRDWIKGAAIVEEAGNLQILMACDDLQLVGKEFMVDRPAFKQSCHEALVAVAYCGERHPRAGWRDFLVYFLDGTLHHLCLMPDNRIADLWFRLWDLLGLSGLNDKQVLKARWRSEQATASQAQRMAVIRAVLDHFFEDSHNQEGGLDAFLKSLIDWLDLDESDQLLKIVIEYILDRFHQCSKNWPQAHQKGEALLVALRHLYKNRFRLSFQDRVDRYFRSLKFEPAPPSSMFDRIKKHSGRNRDMVWVTTRDYADRPLTAPDEYGEESALEAALWQGKLAMERWMNAFWLADAQYVESIKDRPLVGLIGLGNSHLVMATRTRLFLGAVDTKDHRLRSFETIAREGDDRDPIMRIAKLAEKGLVLATASGMLQFYSMVDNQLCYTHSLKPDEKGAPWVLALLTEPAQHLFVAFNDERRSWLAHATCERGRWSYKKRLPFDLPKVRFLAAASTRGHIVIAKASTYAGLTSLCILDSTGTLNYKMPAMETLTGVTALAFDCQKSPRHLMVGDRQGFVYCLHLGENPDVPAELVWTFRCKATVRSICPWHYKANDHFILGSDAGELVMLRALDGCRVWKKTLTDPIRRITTLGADYLAVYQARGLVSLYRPIAEQEGALQTVYAVNKWIEKKITNRTDRIAQVWCFSDNQSLQAFFKRERLKHPYSYILGKFKSKEPRGRIIAYFARLTDELAQMEDLFSAAKFREFYLLAAYLPEKTPLSVFKRIWQIMLTRRADEQKGPNSEAARMAAFSVLLQRFQAYEWTLSDILDLKAPFEILRQHWPALAFARLLIATVPAEQRFSAVLFQRVSPLLFGLPPTLTRALIQMTPPLSPACGDFQLFERARQALLKSQAIEIKDFNTLQILLRPFAEERSICGFLYWHLTLVGVVRSLDEGQSWLELRPRFHQALAKIYLTGFVPRSGEVGPGETFLQWVRSQLHADPPLGESVTLQARQDWCDQSLRRLNADWQQKSINLSWQEEMPRLADHLRRLLLRTLPLERAYLAEEVRPRLELVKLERLHTGQVELHLRATPEGNGELQQVSVVFEAKGDQGLREPGRLRDVRERARFPGEFPTLEVVLTGFLHKDQTAIRVTVAIKAKDYPQRMTPWELDLKAHLLRPLGDADLAQHLPAAYQWVLKNLPTNAGTHLVVFDDPEQQRRLGQDWAQCHRGLIVDLDELLADCGPGGTYAVTEASGNFVRERLRRHLREAFATHGLSYAGTPVCFAPFSVVGARWLSRGGQELLRNLLATFLDQTVVRERAWLLMLSGQIWRACNSLFDRDQVVFPYAMVRQHMFDNPTGDVSQQYGALLARAIGKNKQVPVSLAKNLNFDFRLVFLWLAWFQKTDARKDGITAFYETPEVRRFILDELAALPIEEIMVLLLGSIASAQIQLKQLREGMFIGEERRSRLADGKPGKRLHGVGERLSDHDVQILRSVGGQGETIIQGFGVGALSPELSQLERLLTLLFGQSTKAAYQHLHYLGMAHYSGQWLRTESPFFEFFKALHHHFSKESDPLGCIFREVLGRGRFILENMSFDRLEQFQSVNYRLGNAKDEDILHLNQLRLLWQAGISGEPAAILCRELGLRRPREQGPAFSRLEKLTVPVLLRGFAGEPGSFWAWLPEGAVVDFGQLVECCQSALVEYLLSLEKEENKSNEDAPPKTVPRVLVFGPGAELLPPDDERRFAVIRQAHFLKSLYEGDLLEGLVSSASSQLKLVALSPYQLSGPLPPGSRLFKGRSSELEFIKSRIREVSTLIVGSRRVGKTSFLNQVLHWAQRQPGVCPVYLDLQNASTEQHFRQALQDVMKSPRNYHLSKHLPREEQPVLELNEFVQRFHRQGLLPIFLLNEVDRLVNDAPDLIGAWRKLHEDHQARFIMVGYVSLLRLEEAASPLNHFTQGTSARSKAITLTALSPAAAAEILDLLESPELGLSWASTEEKRRAYQLCQKRSFCIPWVLQQMGHHILESLERRREEQLSYDLVEDALSRAGDVVWNYISAIHYHRMGLTKRPADEHGYKIILYGLVRKKYLLGTHPAIKDEDLANRNPLGDFGFTTAEAEDILSDLMSELLLGREFVDLDRWLRELQLGDVLNLMTLTLILEPDPSAANRYAFLMHILPMELVRHYSDDPTLDNLIIDEAKRFMRLISNAENNHV